MPRLSKKAKAERAFFINPLTGKRQFILYVNIAPANVSRAIVLRFLLAPTIKSVSKRVPQTPHNLQTIGRWGNTLPAL